jgi:ubiquinone/menaquinone biosynthesis C-methylase UbiE
VDPGRGKGNEAERTLGVASARRIAAIRTRSEHGMTASESFRDFERKGWSSAATTAAYHRHIAALTTSCIPELLRAAAVGVGDRVLDVACGAGYVAAAARDVGADATGIDFSAEQVRLAQESYPGLAMIAGDALALPFADGSFDVVLNAFGLPRVADHAQVAREACRVLAPGGRFAYASWCAPDKCIAFSLVYDAIRAHGTLDVGLPVGPDFFACGEQGYARAMLARAGFADVHVVELPLVWRSTSPDEFIAVLSSGTVRAAATLKAQDPESLPKIREYLHARIAGFAQNGAYLIPAPALVVSARKPS